MNRKKVSNQDRIFDVVIMLFLTFTLIVVSYPLIYVISASFSNPDALIYGKVWLFPVGFSFDGYVAVLNYKSVWTGYANTIINASIGTFINVLLTIVFAYPLARKDLVGRNVVMFFVTLTMFLSGGLIPSYLLMQDLGLINSRWSLIFPTAISAWNLILTRTFIQTSIPQEIYDSADIDGCGNVKFLWSMVIPLSKSILAVITLYYAVTHWNAYFNAMIYLRDEKLYPLQLVLRNILIENQLLAGSADVDVEAALQRERMAELLKYALIIVSSLPLMVMYPFVQKHFVKGVMVGSVKG